MRVTQKHIARALNVSSITVHRALNNSGYVSKALKEKILDYAKRVNYIPHKASQVLVRNRIRKIAVFSSEEPKYFWNDVRTGIRIASQQIQPFDFQVRYCMIPGADSGLYLSRLEEVIADGVDAMAVVNQWIYDMNSIIGCLESRDVPYITVNIDAPESGRLCFIGPDYPAGGRLAAEFIGKALTFKENPRVLVINKTADMRMRSNAPDINRQRLHGFLNELGEQFGRIDCRVRIVGAVSGSESIERDIEEIVRPAVGAVDAIYLIPPFNRQFVRVMEKLKLAGKLIVVLHDLDPHTNHYLAEKWVTAVIYQNPILQGYYAVKVLEDILESGRPPENVHIPIVHSLILNENRDLYRNHYLFTQMSEKR